MEKKQTIAMFGHTFTIWQGADGGAVILQIDDVYLLGDANQNGDLVIPHHLLLTDNLDAAQGICQTVTEAGASVAMAARHFARKGGM